MLVGIVAMQVEVLKLGAGMGRSIQRASALESRNQQLRASVASLGDDQRIERIASGMGMVMPAPDAIGFLSRGQGMNVQQAISNIHVPNAAGFLALLSSNGAVVTGDPATSGESGTSITGTPGANAPISGASGDTTSTTPSTATPGSSTTTPTTPAIATPGTTTPSTTPPGG